MCCGEASHRNTQAKCKDGCRLGDGAGAADGRFAKASKIKMIIAIIASWVVAGLLPELVKPLGRLGIPI